MPTILNTGQGVFPQVTRSSYDPVKAVEQAGRMEAEMMDYQYKIRKERENQFLNLAKTETDDMVLGVVQDEQAKKINEFNTKWTDQYNVHKGNLPLEKLMEMQRDKNTMESWQKQMFGKMQEYKKRLNLLYQDGGRELDFEDETFNLNEFANDPLNKSIQSPVLKPKTMGELYQDIFKSRGADFVSTDKIEEKKVGDKIYGYKVYQRKGLMTPEQIDQAWNEELENNIDLNRAILKSWNGKKVGDNKYEGGVKSTGRYKNPNEYANDIWKKAFENSVKYTGESADIVSNRTTNFNYGGGGKANKIKYSTEETQVNPVTGNVEKSMVVIPSGTGGKGVPIIMDISRVKDSNGKKLEGKGTITVHVNRLFNNIAQASIPTNFREDTTIPRSSDKNSITMRAGIKEDIDNGRRFIVTTKDDNGNEVYYVTTASDQKSGMIDLTNDVLNQLYTFSEDNTFKSTVESYFGSTSKKEAAKKPVKETFTGVPNGGF